MLTLSGHLRPHKHVIQGYKVTSESLCCEQEVLCFSFGSDPDCDARKYHTISFSDKLLNVHARTA